MTGLGMSLVTVLGAYKSGLLAAARAVYDPHVTYVCSGNPSQDVLYELVQIDNAQIGQTPATVGTNRGREEILTCTVILSAFSGGDDDQQDRLDLRVAELLTLLEKQVHYTDTTLGGIVRDCFLTAARLDSGTAARGPANNEVVGRMAAINATFTAHARILNG